MTPDEIRFDERTIGQLAQLVEMKDKINKPQLSQAILLIMKSAYFQGSIDGVARFAEEMKSIIVRPE